jgi:hypothetical protein
MSEVRNVAAFHNPFVAILKNQQPVKILAIGDEAGKSPVFLIVDEQGRSTWQSVTECRIIDSVAIPYTVETLRALTSQR